MRNIKLTARILGGFGLAFLAFIGATAASFSVLQDVKHDADVIQKDNLPGVYLAGQIESHISENTSYLRAFIEAEGTGDGARMRQFFENQKSVISELLRKYESTITTPEDRAIFERAKELRAGYLGSRDKVVVLLEQRKSKEAAAVYVAETKSATDRYLDGVRAISEFNRASGDKMGDHINRAVDKLQSTTLGGIALAAMIGLVLAVLITRSVTHPLSQVVDHAVRVGNGDFASRCEYHAADEVGQVAAAVNKMTEDLDRSHANDRARIEQERLDASELQAKVDLLLGVVQKMREGDLQITVTGGGADAIGQLGEGIQSLVDDLSANMTAIMRNAQTLAASSEQLSQTSQQMASASEETSAQAVSVSSASEEVSKNVQSVATGAEEMTASIKEIARNAQDATRIASSAVEMAQSASTIIGKLGDSSGEIGKVIKVITSIAEQTNLLALNATIEAARAGDAGKGFAVVANEVKELAKETAKATEEISAKIEAIQGDTDAAIKAIEEIRKIISQVNDISTTIASAVEEQTATTNEIGRSVGEAASGTTDIARSISTVAEAAQSTAAGVTESMAAASALTEMAADLHKLVSRFRLSEHGSVRPGTASLQPPPSRGGNGHGAKGRRPAMFGS